MSASSGWDAGSLHYNNTLGINTTNNSGENDKVLSRRCLQFLEQFRIDATYPYREQLRRQIGLQQFTLIIDIGHIQAFDELLNTQLTRRPAVLISLLENACKQLAALLAIPLPVESAGLRSPLSDFQVQLTAASLAIPSMTSDVSSTSSSSSSPTDQPQNLSTGSLSIRHLDSQHIGKLVRIPGIIISASGILSKPVSVCIQCKSCRQERYLINDGVAPLAIPRVCTGPPSNSDANNVRDNCGLDPFVIMGERTRCVDQQTLKLQEAPDMVPVGELPRQVILSVDRSLVNKISTGQRLTVFGIYSIMSGKSSSSKQGSGANTTSIRTPFMRVLGLSDTPSISNTTNATRHTSVFSEGEEREMASFARQPDLYNKFASSIAPSIFGCDDMKKAVSCLLFGGSRKRLPDRIRLRGDINVLLLGDPGVAKSQLLKFVEKVAPISVYTSGKGSSAAGLTASVVRDPGSGEFYLEGGAMVLADGGVVCIDEFDKMDPEDRVAIHEAMEQQTISIAKAGITTILNSRTSVLAAANPVFGRYDEMRTPGENIDFSSTILSRFDMIFVVRDEHNASRDITLAKHVLSVHINAKESTNPSAGGSGTCSNDQFDLATMKKYISFAKSSCSPRLSPRAAERLCDHYVSMRAQVNEMESKMAERSSIPITIRQLEAIVRISESLAKMTLSSRAEMEHVEEALRLFRVSTMQAVYSGHNLEGMSKPELVREVNQVERVIKGRLPHGATISYKQLVQELTTTGGGAGGGNTRFSEASVMRAIDGMIQQEKLIYRQQRKMLVRQR